MEKKNEKEILHSDEQLSLRGEETGSKTGSLAAARSSDDEKCRLALSDPGLARHLELNTLPADRREILLRKKPSLAGHFVFEKNDPPGTLSLEHFLDNCSDEEIRAAASYLCGLFPDLSYEEAARMADEGAGCLGVFPRERGIELTTQINRALTEKGISTAALEALWRPLPLPLFAPVDNLEARILDNCTGKIVEACMEDEVLSRPDILCHNAFALLRQDVQDLVLMKAVPPEMRQAAVGLLIDEDASYILIEHVRAACRFGTLPAEHSKYEKILLEAVAEKEFKVVEALTEAVCFGFLSVEEVIRLYRMLPEKLAQKVFDRSILPLQRGYLLAELTELAPASETVAIVNMLLQVFWRPERDPHEDEFVTFVDPCL